jgi:sugar (pentulose or hexulose) kinase
MGTRDGDVPQPRPLLTGGAGPLFAGVDVGTTSIKCVVLDRNGAERGSVAAPTRWESGGFEIAADDLVGRALGVITDACAAAGRGRVAAVGITGLAESGVVLDNSGTPAGPVTRWDDPRTAATAPVLYARIGERDFGARTGLPPTGRTTLAKLHREAAAGRLRPGGTWLGVPEIVAHRLGARRVAERSLASRTGLYDVLADAWIPAYLDAADLAGLRLPPLCSADEVIGHVRIGPAAGAVLVVAGHDHVCASVGVGATGADGHVLDSMGTGEALVRTVPVERAEPALPARAVDAGMTVGRHVLPGRLAVSRGLGSGLVLARALRLLGADRFRADGPRRRALDDAARSVCTPPSLVGDVTAEEWTVAGIRPEVGPEALWRAVLDAVAARARDGIAAMDALLGPHDGVVACGGWLRSAAVRETKAAAIGAYEWAATAEPGAVGAALLAASAAGEPIDAVPDRTRVIPPESAS